MTDRAENSPLLGVSWTWAMAFGLGVLRLSPAQFWAMTPRELFAAAEGLGSATGTAFAAAKGPSRDSLRHLMQAYPDKDQGETAHGG